METMKTDCKVTKMLTLDKYFKESFMTILNNIKENMLIMYEKLQHLRR